MKSTVLRSFYITASSTWEYVCFILLGQKRHLKDIFQEKKEDGGKEGEGEIEREKKKRER